jgi:hypothetical protein
MSIFCRQMLIERHSWPRLVIPPVLSYLPLQALVDLILGGIYHRDSPADNVPGKQQSFLAIPRLCLAEPLNHRAIRHMAMGSVQSLLVRPTRAEATYLDKEL